MIFSSNFNAIVAIYILGLVLTVQDAAAVPGLFGKKSYKISELPNLSLNQIAEFIPSPIRVESTFKCADDVCYAQGKNSNKGVTIVCGDDKKDNPKDRTLQVYRSLSSFIPRKTISIYKGTPISVPKYFNLNNGICYIASDTCHVSLSEFKNQVSERYVRIRVIMEARLKDELMMGMLHIYGAGWFMI
ncbi:hypothetical protein BDF19DRAFT_469112 [Syncephalis fuscata]|nr:hypothetical protein BDF19DRAFT_469112 [Syncephalis fuscata]